MEFEHDPTKASANIREHGVSFAEAETVFDDPVCITYADDSHSKGEARYLTIGYSVRGRLLIVWHTETEAVIGLIGARKVTRHERKKYEQRR